jgi:hypothetical protein
MEQAFPVYSPIPINRELFSDQSLTDTQIRILCLCEVFRLEIEATKNLSERNEKINNLTVSKFAIATNKTADHLRRIFSQMSRDANVRKHLIIKFENRRRYNLEDRIILEYPPRLNSLAIKTNVNQIDNFAFESLKYEDELVLKQYLKTSKCFGTYKPITLVKICDVPVQELIKGLIYVDLMNDRKLKQTGKGIDNPVGYLIKCFDQDLKFKYEIIPTKYIPKNTRLTSNSNVEYELTENNFTRFSDYINSESDFKAKIIYRKSNQKVYVKGISKVGKAWNPVVWLKKLDIDFKVVEQLEAGGENEI